VVVARALIDQLRARHHILAFLGGHSYSFVHRTFLEYFAPLTTTTSEIGGSSARSNSHICSASAWWTAARMKFWTLLSGMFPSENMAPCLDVLVSKGAVDLIIRCVAQLQDRKEAAETVEQCRQFLTHVARGRDAVEFDVDVLSGLAQLWRDDITRRTLTELGDSPISKHEQL
jgi:hypothetical protein